MPRQIDEYSLHVLPNGEEQRIDRLPRWEDTRACSVYLRDNLGGAIPVHHVRVLELDDGSVVEEIEIRSIKMNCGQRFICPRPHGAGWMIRDDRSDNYTIYRRMVRASGSPPEKEANDAPGS